MDEKDYDYRVAKSWKCLGKSLNCVCKAVEGFDVLYRDRIVKFFL